MSNLLVSRKFWIALIAVVVVVVQAFFPTFDLDQETAAGLAIIVVSYLIGAVVDPGPGGWRGWIASRKFWAAVIGIGVMLLDAFNLALPFDLSPDQLVAMAVMIGGYISATALEKPLLKK